MKKAGEDADGRDRGDARGGERVKALDAELRQLEEESESLAAWIPNLPHESVPPGRDTSQNRLVRSWGEPRAFDFEPKPHWDLATRLGCSTSTAPPRSRAPASCCSPGAAPGSSGR